MKILINGKTCVVNKEELAKWEIGVALGIDIEYRHRILYTAKDGMPEMLGQYKRLKIHNGMQISIITVNEYGRLLLPKYMKNKG